MLALSDLSDTLFPSFYSFVRGAALCDIQLPSLCVSQIPCGLLMWLLLLSTVLHAAVIAVDMDVGMGLVIVASR